MKYKFIILLTFVTLFSFKSVSQNCSPTTISSKTKPKTIGIVISTNDPETVWNVFRLANYSVQQGDTVSIFLLGKGVEAPNISGADFNVNELMQKFADSNGKLFACGTCLDFRKTTGSKLCPVSSLSDLYQIIKSNEIVLTF